MSEAIKIFFGLVGLIVGVILIVRYIKLHKKIDTESIAIVKTVEKIGRIDLKKAYAIQYTVTAQEEFELLETPCKKALAIGKKRGIFYEKDNPQRNHYFKTIGRYDNRFTGPCFLIFLSVFLIIATIFIPT